MFSSLSIFCGRILFFRLLYLQFTFSQAKTRSEKSVEQTTRNWNRFIAVYFKYLLPACYFTYSLFTYIPSRQVLQNTTKNNIVSCLEMQMKTKWWKKSVVKHGYHFHLNPNHNYNSHTLVCSMCLFFRSSSVFSYFHHLFTFTHIFRVTQAAITRVSTNLPIVFSILF